MLPPEDERLLKENLRARYEMFPYESVVREDPVIPITTENTATAVGCPPELDGKTLSLKVQQTLVTGHREIKLELISKLFCWLDFPVPELMWGASSTVLPS